jgi:hypothetical protein
MHKLEMGSIISEKENSVGVVRDFIPVGARSPSSHIISTLLIGLLSVERVREK